MKKIFILIITIVLMGHLKGQIPDFEIEDCYGQTHHLYDDLAAGKAVIINVCAGWCEPCRYADVVLESVYKQYCSGNGELKTYGLLFENNQGENSDCAFGALYASTYDLSFPLITNSREIADKYLTQYGTAERAIPLFAIIIPNQADPANSTVYPITGFLEDLEQSIKDILISAGYMPQPKPSFEITGNTCTGPVTLTSNSAINNFWSTGETTQSIIVSAPGKYSLTVKEADCEQTVSETFDFNTVPNVGLASISTNNVCLGGDFILDYELPGENAGYPVWQVSSNIAPGVWQDFSDAIYGPINLSTNVIIEAVDLLFRVKVQPGINEVCALYSNELTLSINEEPPGNITGLATVSDDIVCAGNNFTINFSGNEPGSVWQIYDSYYGWSTIADADQGDITFTARENGSGTFNGMPGDSFRVYKMGGSCYSVSNNIAVTYWDPDPIINGPDQVLQDHGEIELTVNDLRNDIYTDILWSPGGETTSSIRVNPDVNTEYSVTVTDFKGCQGTSTKMIRVLRTPIPVISSSANGPVCAGTAVTLQFTGTRTIEACTNAEFGQYPAKAITFSDCNGFELEEIVTDGKTGQYSLVNVEPGKMYIFLSFDQDNLMEDNISITDDKGENVYSTGIGYVYFISNFTGQVRFYTNAQSCIANENTIRARYAYCTDQLDVWGFEWLPGGATTHSITVTPEQTATYSLTFNNYNLLSEFEGEEIPGTSEIEIEVSANKSWILDLDEDGYYPGSPLLNCVSPGGDYIELTTELPGDCNDDNAAVNPSSTEVCGNKIDDNCDGLKDERGCFECGNATNLLTTNISSSSAQLEWTSMVHADEWQLHYKTIKKGNKWTDIVIPGHKRSVIINDLIPNQHYQWEIRAKCGKSKTSYTKPVSFTTLAGSKSSTAYQTEYFEAGNVSLKIYPNPARNFINLDLRVDDQSTSSAEIILHDISGRRVFTEKLSLISGTLHKNMQLPNFITPGIYVVEVIVEGKSFKSKLVLMK